LILEVNIRPGLEVQLANMAPLKERLKKQYSPLIGFCVMIWVLIATPCMATVAIVIQETKSWKWAIYQFLGLTALAYVITFILFQLGRIFI